MKIAIVCPHIFMQDKLLSKVIFSPGKLAISLSEELQKLGNEVTLFSPSTVTTSVTNITEDLTGFEEELELRSYGYQELLKKHPLLFITLAREVQTSLISKAIKMANEGKFDLIHFYMNEEELALIMSDFSKVPTAFTHHDPYNFSAKYRSVMPKFKHKNFISISYSQRDQMPKDTNWVGNVYHGLANSWFDYKIENNSEERYVVFLGRIIKSKGLHLAIKAVQKYNSENRTDPIKLKVAGKHYSSDSKNDHWENTIRPMIDNKAIEYLGFISDDNKKMELLSGAEGLIVPSLFEEPFGMVLIEAMAVGTPVIGTKIGAIPEIIENNKNGFLISIKEDENMITNDIASKLDNLKDLNKKQIREFTKNKFSVNAMAEGHLEIYQQLLDNN